MNYFRNPNFRNLLIFSMAILLIPATVFGITPKEEDDISREFMQYAIKHFPIINDPLIVDYINQVGKNILSKLPPQPFSYRFFILKQDVYNAFAVPAGYIFINSGLLAAMENEDELAGILSHEIAHVVSRHISDRIKRSKQTSAVSIAGMIAGTLLGVGGAGEAAQAVTTGALAAGQSMSLAFSRDDERQADQLGLRYLEKSGYSGLGLLSVMKKIRSKQWYDSSQFPDYLSTHPGSEERMATIDSWLEQHEGTPVSAPPRKTYEFDRAHARLVAEYGEETSALSLFESAVVKNPEDPISHYGYGLILARRGRLDDAIEQLRMALEKRTFDVYILNDLGRVYFLAGRHKEAIDILEGAVSLSLENREAQFLLGRAQMELGELKSARSSFETLITLEPNYPQASYFLGQTYGRLGQLGQAHYFLGIHYKQKGDLKNATFHLTKALSLINDPSRRGKAEEMLRAIKMEKRDSKEG